MLRVTVELWPGGRESSKKVIASADIGRVKNGAHADYEVRLSESPIGSVGIGHVREYPRWSASVWDLVARCIAAALNGGQEGLPSRPTLLEVPVHDSGGLQYVRLREIPEPARTFFQRRIVNSTRPMVATTPSRWTVHTSGIGTRSSVAGGREDVMGSVMDYAIQVLRENWALLAFPACAAAVGYLLGRLIRGRK